MTNLIDQLRITNADEAQPSFVEQLFQRAADRIEELERQLQAYKTDTAVQPEPYSDEALDAFFKTPAGRKYNHRCVKLVNEGLDAWQKENAAPVIQEPAKPVAQHIDHLAHEMQFSSDMVTKYSRACQSFKRECDDVGKLLRSLGLDPESCRTEGGSLNVRRIQTFLGDQFYDAMWKMYSHGEAGLVAAAKAEVAKLVSDKSAAPVKISLSEKMTDYAEIERVHLGDPDLKTGIYHPDFQSKGAGASQSNGDGGN